MIEYMEIDGEPAAVSYIRRGPTNNLELVEPDEAEIIKVAFLDGRHEWRLPKDSNAALDMAIDAFFANDAEFKEAEHPRDKGGKFTSGGGETARAVGGLSPSGRRIIAEYTPRPSPAAVAKVRAEAKARRAVIRQIARQKAVDMDFDPKKVKFINKTERSKIGGVDYITAAETHLSGPQKGTVNIITNRVSPHTVRGIVAHEITHQEWQAMLDAHGAAQAEEPGRTKEEFYTVRAKAVFATVNNVFGLEPGDTSMMMTLAEEDGVSGYSRDVWKDWADDKVPLTTAVHETIAEIGKRNHTISRTEDMTEPSDNWKRLYEAMTAFSRQRRKAAA